MNGVMMPGVSAGSNQVGASATWEAHVNCPDGDALGDCAEACVAATRATATTRATTRARERVMVCPPLRCDKGETCSRAARLPDYPRIPSSVNGVRPLYGALRAIAAARRPVRASPGHGRHPGGL